MISMSPITSSVMIGEVPTRSNSVSSEAGRPVRKNLSESVTAWAPYGIGKEMLKGSPAIGRLPVV